MPTPAKLYDITDLGTLGGTESFAYAINESGQIVGMSRLSDDTTTHVFLYDKGTMTDLNLTNPNLLVVTSPTSINNPGLIATGVRSGGIDSPAIFDSRTGQTTLLGSLGGVTSSGYKGGAVSVNNAGQAVGLPWWMGSIITPSFTAEAS